MVARRELYGPSARSVWCLLKLLTQVHQASYPSEAYYPHYGLFLSLVYVLRRVGFFFLLFMCLNYIHGNCSVLYDCSDIIL